MTGVFDSGLGDSERGRVSPRPTTEFLARAKRRTYTGDYKQQVLAEADAARGSGEIGAVKASAPRLVFIASDQVAPGTQVRNPGRFGSRGKRGPEVKKANPLTAENQKLRSAVRQRPADRSAAQGGDRDRRSKKSGYATGHSDRGDGGIVRTAIGDLTPMVGVKSRLRGFRIFPALLLQERGVWVFLLRRPQPCGPQRPAACAGLLGTGRGPVLPFMRRFQNLARRLLIYCPAARRRPLASLLDSYHVPDSGKRGRRRVSAATNLCIRLTRSPNCWPPVLTSSGAGMSQKLLGLAKWSILLSLRDPRRLPSR